MERQCCDSVTVLMSDSWGPLLEMPRMRLMRATLKASLRALQDDDLARSCPSEFKLRGSDYTFFIVRVSMYGEGSDIVAGSLLLIEVY